MIRSKRADPQADTMLATLARTKASTPFGERLVEYAVWYHKNLRRIPEGDLAKRCRFLEVAMGGCLELIAMLAKEVKPELAKQRVLYIPKGVEVQGDLTRFG